MSFAVSTNSTLSTLSPVQAQVVEALAQGSTITAAAGAAGLHRTTIHHWIKSQPEFAAALNAARRERVAALRDEMKELSSLALRTLRSLLDDPATPPHVRLKTALAVLGRPHFPEQDWHLPDPIASTEEQRLLRDLACMKADYKLLSMEEKINRHAREPVEEPAGGDPVEAPADPESHTTPRNAFCPCGSGLKFKRCCARGAPAVLAG